MENLRNVKLGLFFALTAFVLPSLLGCAAPVIIAVDAASAVSDAVSPDEAKKETQEQTKASEDKAEEKVEEVVEEPKPEAVEETKPPEAKVEEEVVQESELVEIVKIKEKLSWVNIRPEPSTKKPSISTCKGGAELEKLEEKGNWFKVKFLDKDNKQTEGWIYKYLLEGYEKPN